MSMAKMLCEAFHLAGIDEPTPYDDLDIGAKRATLRAFVAIISRVLPKPPGAWIRRPAVAAGAIRPRQGRLRRCRPRPQAWPEGMDQCSSLRIPQLERAVPAPVSTWAPSGDKSNELTETECASKVRTKAPVDASQSLRHCPRCELHRDGQPRAPVSTH